MKTNTAIPRETIRAALVDVLTEVLEAGNCDTQEFRDDLCLLEDLDGFDSLNAVEVECELEIRLGVKIPEGVLYKKGCPATLGEIGEHLYQSLNPAVNIPTVSGGRSTDG